MIPEIVFEDADLLAVNKPAGMLVHGTPEKRHQESDPPSLKLRRASRREEPTVVDWLRENRPEVGTVGDDPSMRPGIVHRLDRDTSGILVVAKTQQMFDHLKSCFARREAGKTYIALAHGIPSDPEGTIEKPISLVRGTTRRTVRGGRMEKPAVTRYAVRKELRDEDGALYALLAVFPKTGRTHQIRVHLASIRHPIAGDPLYGRRHEPEWVHRLALHAHTLELPLPDGKRLALAADPPKDFPLPPIVAGTDLSTIRW